MLCEIGKLVRAAGEERYAVPAFNVYNMETAMGVMQAAEEERSPVILQVYSRLFENGKAQFLAPVILKLIETATVPAAFHLDHGSGLMAVTRALRYGASGIMIDASLEPMQENIRITKTVVDLCRNVGVGVEGELGHIGSAAAGDETAGNYTEVQDAMQFAKETGVAALAVMVGTAHGRYQAAPTLQIERIHQIREATKLPLVLHGGSGVPDDQIRAAVEAGICKVNFGTDLCYSFLDQIFETSRKIVAVDLFMDGPTEAVKRFAADKIRLLGADGHA